MVTRRSEILWTSSGSLAVVRDYDAIAKKDEDTKKRIVESGRRARGGLTFINEGAKEAKRELESLGDSAGPVGRVLARTFGAGGALVTGIAAGTVAVGLLTGATLSLSRSIGVTSDKYTLLESRLKQIGATRSMEPLIDLSRELGQSVDDTVGTFARFQIAGDNIGLVEEQVAQLTEVVFKLGRIGGASGTELASASTQLAQGLAAGTLRGEELNSVLEGMPLVAKAIAESLGVGVGELKSLAEQGKLTSSVVSEGLIGIVDQVRDSFAELPRTIEQQESAIGTAWEKVLVNLDKRTKASDFYRDVLLKIERVLDATGDALAPETTGDKIRDRIDELRRLEKQASESQSRTVRPSERGLQDPRRVESDRTVDTRTAALREEIALLSERAQREAVDAVNRERIDREEAKRKADERKRLADLKKGREAAVKPLDDQLKVQSEIYRLEEAITVVGSGGIDKLNALERELKLREAARQAAEAFNRSNKKAIVDGEVQLRTAEDYLDILRRQEELKGELAASTRIAELKEDVAAQEKLAAAQREGTEAVLAATEAEEIRLEVRKLGLEQGSTEADQLAEQIRLLNEKKRAAATAETIREAEEELEYQQKLAVAYQEGAEAVEALNVEYAVKKKLTEAGVKADSEAGRQLAEVTRQLERQKIATGKVNAAADAYREVWRNTLEDVQTTMTDAIDEGLDGNLDSVEGWADRVWSIVRRLIANLATQKLVIPFVTAGADLLGLGASIPAEWRAAAGGQAGQGQSGIGFDPLSALSKAFGGGQGGFLNGIVNSSFGASLGLSTAIGPAAGPTLLSAGVPAFTAAQEAGLIAGGWTGFAPTQLGAGLLGAAGPIAAIAAIALPLLMSQFGRKPSVGPTTVGRITDLTDSSSAVYTFDNGGDDDTTVKSIIRAIVDGIEANTRRYSGTLRPGSGFDVGYFPEPEQGNSQPGGVNIKAIIDNVLEDRDRFKGLSEQEAISKATYIALKEMVDYQSDTLDAIAEFSDAEDLPGLQRDLALGERLDYLREAITDLGGTIDANTVVVAQQIADRKEAAREFADTNAAPIVSDYGRLLELFPSTVEREISSRKTVRGVYTGSARHGDERFVEEGTDEFDRLTSGDNALPVVTQIRGVTKKVTEQVDDYAGNLSRVADSSRFASEGLQLLIQQLTGEFEPALEGVFSADYAQRAANIEAVAPHLEDFNDQLRQAYENFPELTEQLGPLNDVLVDVTGTVSTALDTLRTEMAQDLRDSFTARRNQATGLGAINQIGSLIDQRTRDLSDTAALGVDDSLALGTFEDELRALLGGTDLGTLNRIISSGQLTDPQTLTLLGEIRDELIEGGAVEPAVATAVQTIQAQIGALEQSADAADALADALFRSADALLIDTSLSPLSPEAQRAEALQQLKDAQRAFSEASTDQDRADAASQAQTIGRSFLQASLAVFGATPEYKSDFDYLQDLLRTMGGQARSQADVARDSLKVLEEIRDRLAPPSSSPGIPIEPPSGFDLGRNEERNRLIYRTLAAAGLPVPSGFGEGQLNALRASNTEVDAVVRALGFSAGGLVAGGVPGRDSVPALLMPGEDVYSVDNSAVVRRLAANNNVEPVVRRLDGVEAAIMRLVSVQERMLVQHRAWADAEQEALGRVKAAVGGPRMPIGARKP